MSVVYIIIQKDPHSLPSLIQSGEHEKKKNSILHTTFAGINTIMTFNKNRIGLLSKYLKRFSMEGDIFF